MFLHLLSISLPFHLFGFLCLGFPFCRLEVHDSSLLWVGLYQWLVNVSCANLCLCFGEWSRIPSLWSAMKCPVVSFVVSLGLAWLWVAYLLMLTTVFLICWRISMACLALEIIGSWVGPGFSVELGVLWSCQVLKLSLLPLAFSMILTVASKLLHPYSTDDTAPRLMVKQFSIARDTQRSSQSYMEKKRGWERDRDREREEIEVTRRRRGVKNGESTLSSNQLPKCSPQSGTPREIHRVT